MVTKLPTIPEYITVHLGSPNSNATNVVVNFVDYIKNVASSEIYPTWEKSAISANVHAQTSYALNRVYTEFYRSKGYNFDITNTTALDQSFTPNRNIFANIDQVVSELFNDYIRRKGFAEPLAAKYCNGTTSTCNGLSQWGSEKMAREGKNSIDILKYYYGDNIELVINAPVAEIPASYPGNPVKLGSSGKDVITIQVCLNRISQNYPTIPKINPVDGLFGVNTENSVKAFQGIFNLTKDGIVGNATWYKIVNLYVGVKKLSELNSEGQAIVGRSLEYPDAISAGDRGEKVTILQFFLSVLAEFYNDIPFLEISGIYEEQTINAVVAFQRNNNLPESGVVDEVTWNLIYECYQGILLTTLAANAENSISAEPFPGEILKVGSKGTNVRYLQQYLNTVSSSNPAISPVVVTGYFGDSTENAVKAFQKTVGLRETGEVDRTTWNELINSYKNIISAKSASPRQYPGFILKLGTKDSPNISKNSGNSVRSTQTYLRTISNHYKSAPKLIPDGIYGQQTFSAVLAFQRAFGLSETGEVDYECFIKILAVHDDLTKKTKEPTKIRLIPKEKLDVLPGDKGVHLIAIKGVLNAIGNQFDNFDPLTTTDTHDSESVQMIKNLQKSFFLPETGAIDHNTWDKITALYVTL